MTARVLRPVITLTTVMAILVTAIAAYAFLTTGTTHADSTYKPETRVRFCNNLPNPFPGDTSGDLNGDPGSPNCTEGAGMINGANPNITTELAMVSGDLNFSNVVTLFPTSTVISTSPVTVGEKVGGLHSDTFLGTLNQPCDVLFPVDFVFFNVALPNMVGGRVDTSTNLAWPQPEGTSVRFGRWQEDSEPIAGGGSTISTAGFSVNTANGGNIPIQNYPWHLVRVFDRDIVPNASTTPTAVGLDSVRPSHVYGGLTRVAGTEWVPLYFVQFDQTGANALSTSGHEPLSLITSTMGQPSVSVLNDPSATQASPSTITDFCTPLKVTTALLGMTEPGNEVRATNLAVGTAFFMQYNASYRDAEQDSYENALDTCAKQVNEGSPRVSLSGDPDNDGIDNVCDPDDFTGPNDNDGDGFDNRQDNCPLVANVLQTDSELTAAASAADSGPRTDQIGDGCDSGGAFTFIQNCGPQMPVAPVLKASPTHTPQPAPTQGPCPTTAWTSITPSDTVPNGRYMTVTNVVPKCIEAGLPIDQDVDLDGYCKNGDVQGDGGTDSCTTTSPNSCFTRHNAWAASSPMMQMDTDGDKQSDALETYVGTDPVQSCSATTGNNNEPMDNWMFDLNDNTSVNSQDSGAYAIQPLGVGGTFVAQGPFAVGTFIRPQVRYDFNSDGLISGGDSGKFGGVGPYTGGVGPNNKLCASAGINPFLQQ